MHHERNGLFITVEGPEGAGKTTVMKKVATQLLQQGVNLVTTREPGGIRIAEHIRSIILDNRYTEMDARTEALLYAAARRQHLVEKVKPAIEAGQVVLCDRFVDASLAYQGYARGIGVEEVRSINAFAIDSFMPDLTLLFDLDPKIGLERIAKTDERENNRLDKESLAFHEKVREGYLKLANDEPDRFVVIDASQSEEDVTENVQNVLKKFLSHA